MDSVIQYPCFIGPSKIKTLVVPIGNWKRKDFLKILDKLKEFNEIRLVDITPIDSTLFNPQGFPNGRLFFDFNTLNYNKDNELDLFLYDFEPFRKTFIVIGLVNDHSDPIVNLNILKNKYRTIISHNLIYCQDLEDKSSPINNTHNCYITNLWELDNLETILCDIGRDFLIALNRYYSSYKHVTLRSPGTIGGNSIKKTVINKYMERPVLNSQLVNSSNLISSNTSASNAITDNSPSSKRLSAFEITTNNLKRSASIKLTSTLTSSESKAQQRSKGRQLKILGNFQLLAGRYLDALNSFTESIMLLYKVRDLLWLGSALDGISMTFVLLSYLNISFVIPEIISIVCSINIQTKNSSFSYNNGNGANSNNNSSPNINTEKNGTSSKVLTPRNSVSVTPLQLQIASPRNSLVFSNTNSYTGYSNDNLTGSIPVEEINLPKLIKLISDKVLYYYELSLSNNNEYVPQIVYCNTVLKILIFIVKSQRSDDNFSPFVLKDLISDTFEPDTFKARIYNSKNVDPVQFTAADVYYYISRLFELDIHTMTLDLQSSVYGTAAAIYRILGLSKKEAFVLKLFFTSLLRSSQNVLCHPEFEVLLDKIVELYECDKTKNKSIENLSRISNLCLALQKSVLELVIKVSKKFNNLKYVVKYSLILLTQYESILTAEEQNEILQNIKNGIEKNHVTEYWDKNVLQSVTIIRQDIDDNQETLLPLVKKVQNDRISLEDPVKPIVTTEEIFNPFKEEQNILEDNGSPSFSTYLVNDKVEICFTVKNSYKFPLLITGIDLLDCVKEFCLLVDNYITVDNPFVVNPKSIAFIKIPLIFKKDTNDKILQISSILLSVFKMSNKEYKINAEHDSVLSVSMKNSFAFKILPEQPCLRIINTSKMTDNCIMMLDGTKRNFHLKLINKSLNCPINYLKYSIVTNVERNLNPAYWQKLVPDELYFFEKQLEQLKKNCITVHHLPSRMEPNEMCDLQLEVDLGNAPSDFSDFDLIIEYGMKTDDGLHLFVKELRSHFEITIKKSLEISNIDIISLGQNISNKKVGTDWVEYIQNKLQNNISDSKLNIYDFSLLLVDFRNSWIDGISVQTFFDDFKSKKYTVEAQHILRVIIPIRKIETQEETLSERPIPVIFKKRQFIQSGLSKTEENIMREKFWCQEYILQRLECKWSFFHDDTVIGTLNMRNYISKLDCDIVPILYKGNNLFLIHMNTDKTCVEKGDFVSVDVSLSPNKIKDNIGMPDIVSVNLLIFDNKTTKLLLDSNRRVLYNGSLKKLVSSRHKTVSNFEFLPIEHGEYRLSVCITSGKDRNTLLQADSSIIVITVT